jgi:hypothetical protein
MNWNMEVRFINKCKNQTIAVKRYDLTYLTKTDKIVFEKLNTYFIIFRKCLFSNYYFDKIIFFNI